MSDVKEPTPSAEAKPETNAEPTEGTAQGEAAGSPQDHLNSIARDFQKLGQSIAKSVDELWKDERNREQLSELREGLENVAHQVGDTIDKAANNERTSGVKDNVKRTVGEVKDFGDRVYKDSKPHLVGALRALSNGINTIVERLETSAKPEADTAPPASSTPPPPTTPVSPAEPADEPDKA